MYTSKCTVSYILLNTITFWRLSTHGHPTIILRVKWASWSRNDSLIVVSLLVPYTYTLIQFGMITVSHSTIMMLVSHVRPGVIHVPYSSVRNHICASSIQVKYLVLDVVVFISFDTVLLMKDIILRFLHTTAQCVNGPNATNCLSTRLKSVGMYIISYIIWSRCGSDALYASVNSRSAPMYKWSTSFLPTLLRIRMCACPLLW